jgi:hypothetical protein
MESLYYVMSWLCHRTCSHCYDDRFRPYHGSERERQIAEAERNAPRILANLPECLTYRDWNDGLREKSGRIILAGGEILLSPLRERVLYPALKQIGARYEGRAKVIIQTTGDTLKPELIDELLGLGVWMISVSGMDEFHEGLDIYALRARLTSWFDSFGMRPGEAASPGPGPYYHFFGAVPGSWIGKLWPRGRALTNELSTADLSENFCNRWSGGVNFLAHGHSGSEVSIDPEGNVYPCCPKTRLALGNLVGESLESILRRHEGNPVYEAISMGHPERMGIAHGWTVDRFLEESQIRLPSGRIYRNLCIGCDRFHEQVLAPQLVQLAR